MQEHRLLLIVVPGIVNGFNEGSGDSTVHISVIWELEHLCHLLSLSVIITHLYDFFSVTFVTVFSIFTDKCLAVPRRQKKIIIRTHAVFNLNLSVHLQLSAQLPCLIIGEKEA